MPSFWFVLVQQYIKPQLIRGTTQTSGPVAVPTHRIGGRYRRPQLSCAVLCRRKCTADTSDQCCTVEANFSNKPQLNSAVCCTGGILHSSSSTIFICLIPTVYSHKLNIEIDLQVYLGSICTAVLIGWDTTHLDSSTRALLVSQDRRHLFMTPYTYSQSGPRPARTSYL